MHRSVNKKGTKLSKWKLYLSAIAVAIWFHLFGLKYFFALPSHILAVVNDASSTSLSLKQKESPSFYWKNNFSTTSVQPLSRDSRNSTNSGDSQNVFTNAESMSLESRHKKNSTNTVSPTFATNTSIVEKDRLGDELNFSSEFLLYTAPGDGKSSRYFQPIDNQDSWIYSAFHQEGTPSLIRLIGIANYSRIPSILFCHFESQHGLFLFTATGRPVWFSDSHRLQVRACEFHCHVNQSQRPYFVKVSLYKTPPVVSNRLPILYTSGQRIRNFTVCLSTLHSNYDNSWQLVQTIEFNRVLGAEHFMIYYVNASSDVQTILQGYRDEGLITTLPWPVSHIETWYFGQLTSIADCIHRNRNVSRFVVITDADEIIVPNNHSNWWDMIQDLSVDVSLRDLDYTDRSKFHGTVTRRQVGSKVIQHGQQLKHFRNRRSPSEPGSQNKPGLIDFRIESTKTNETVAGKLESGHEDHSKQNHNGAVVQQEEIDSFSFRCAFYVPKSIFTKSLQNYKSLEAFTFSPDQISLLGKVHLAPVHDLVRGTPALTHGRRSKYIVKPDAVNMAGIHIVMRHNQGFNTVFVKTEVALLHHYRMYHIKALNMLDTSALRFKDKFMQFVQRAIQKFPFLMNIARTTQITVK